MASTLINRDGSVLFPRCLSSTRLAILGLVQLLGYIRLPGMSPSCSDDVAPYFALDGMLRNRHTMPFKMRLRQRRVARRRTKCLGVATEGKASNT
ncbi:hypothetical protein BKA80DRAFT_263646 [Phyllosticta citrichinensis]